ncbi:hypothetical protein SDC9_153990 [bioreactor metagenome]|uniref:Uncharacterized protein n=1 Tax=bioreactor metagenome TaxID=1076179 RepID=A0A645F2C0_9ZZZZ
MSVGTNTSKEQIDTSVRSDFSLISSTFSIQIRSIAIQNVYIFLLHINMTEKIIPHEGVIALFMALWYSHIFIHVKSNHIFKRNFTLLVKVNQVFVGTKRC